MIIFLVILELKIKLMGVEVIIIMKDACTYVDSDYELTILGYDFLKKNGTTNWIKLSVDSWLIDEDKIINIFEDLESKNCVYANDKWYSHINLSTDIFFANKEKCRYF